MKPLEPNEPLDALLQEQDGYIADNGFTAKVVAKLPRRQRTWLRPAILIGAAMIGFALAAWWLPSLKDIFVTTPSGGVVLQLSSQSLLSAGVLLVAVGSLVWGVFAAVLRED